MTTIGFTGTQQGMTEAQKDCEMSDTLPLKDCPIGLFISESGELCLKTEYGNNDGRIDAFIVSTGEFFWGSAPQTIASQREQLVRPADADVVPLTRCSACDGDGTDPNGEDNCRICHGHGWIRLGPRRPAGSADKYDVPRAEE